MQDNSDSVMLALLPITTDWCNIELPHMTLVYVGKTWEQDPDLKEELLKAASDIAEEFKTLYLRVIGLDVFGGGADERVNVLKFLSNQELSKMRGMVEKWNGSEHIFSPHATIGPVTEPVNFVPAMLAFDRIALGWGNDYTSFRLKS